MEALQSLESLAESFPDAARDLRLNLTAVLRESSLEPRARFAVALASALASGSRPLAAAIEQDGAEALDEAARDDAAAAVALMAMNNVFYRFRHMVGKPAYELMPPRLRMQRIGKPRTSKAEFELMCLAVSAIEGCELCLRSHEESVLAGGLTEENVFDAVRIAAVVRGCAAAAALAFAEPVPDSP
ncbi:MAG: carboxymuconolactone decarboxylase family protein [Planctomycetota bacterium]